MSQNLRVQNRKTAYFTTIDLKYAKCQLQLHAETDKNSTFDTLC